MYETLVRQHDLAVYQMPSLEDAVDKLKNIESRKKSRRAFQKQRALEDKTDQAKRKAEEIESGAEDVLSKKVKLQDGIETPPTADASEEVGVKTEVTAEDVTMSTREPSAEEQKDSTTVKKEANSDYKKPSQEERRYLSTKPAPQGRGHTSYLTFAFLMPEASTQ